jgi:hypothetical protein
MQNRPEPACLLLAETPAKTEKVHPGVDSVSPRSLSS